MADPATAAAVDKLAALVATWVDSTIAHAHAHCCPPATQQSQQGQQGGKGGGGVILGPTREPEPDDDPVRRGADELGSVTTSEHLQCARSWTDVAGQVRVVCTTTTPGVPLSRPAMHRVPAGDVMLTSVTPADPYPSHLQGAGTHEVVVAMDPTLDRGLYLGTLRNAATASTVPVDLRAPVVIYLDGLS